MKRFPRQSQRTLKDAAPRSGMVALEVVLSLAVTFTFALVMYAIAEAGCFRLYQFISAIVGSSVW